MGSLLNSTHSIRHDPVIPMSASVPSSGKNTPSKKLIMTNVQTPLNSLPHMPMDKWNMKTPPTNTHPYLRLFEIVGAKKEHMKWHRRAKARSQRHKLKRKMSLESSQATDSMPSPPKKATAGQTHPRRNGRTLKLSSEARAQQKE